MIDEKQLEQLRHSEYNGDPVLEDVMDTLETLWGVVRAAERWMQAIPGDAARTADNELIDVLEKLEAPSA